MNEIGEPIMYTSSHLLEWGGIPYNVICLSEIPGNEETVRILMEMLILSE